MFKNLSALFLEIAKFKEPLKNPQNNTSQLTFEKDGNFEELKEEHFTVEDGHLNICEMKVERAINILKAFNEDEEMSKKVKVINFKEVSLVAVEKDMFSNFTNLQRLYLDGNKINSIHPEAFSGLLENLNLLDLSENLLNEIPSDAFEKISNLKYFYISGNPIAKIKQSDFSNILKLRFLIIPEGEIERECLKNFSELKSLTFTHRRDRNSYTPPYLRITSSLPISNLQQRDFLILSDDGKIQIKCTENLSGPKSLALTNKSDYPDYIRSYLGLDSKVVISPELDSLN
jgi:hypothetical protein